MGKSLIRLAVVAGAVASMAFASPAAATTCVGTQQTVGICFDVSKTTLYEDCVYVGSPPCIPVRVPGVDVDCWGWIGDDGVIMCA